ncbi:hypothetical protein JA1_003625 [Spathaspora sp. JA1]|nr:hypothetical protein JA1_003625 [Spathaspora sp. JA1]
MDDIESNSSKSSSKRSTYTFTYDSDNYLLNLITKNKQEIFTRGNKIKTWDKILTEFNNKFNAGFIQSRTLSHRFDILVGNLEHKYIHVQSILEPRLFNENERVVIEIVQFMMIADARGVSDNLAELINRLNTQTANAYDKMSMETQGGVVAGNTNQRDQFAYEEHRISNGYVQIRRKKLSSPSLKRPSPRILPERKNGEYNTCRDSILHQSGVGQSHANNQHNPQDLPILNGRNGYDNQSHELDSYGANDEEIFNRFLLMRNDYNAQMNTIKLEIRQLRNEVDFKLKRIENSIASTNDNMDEKLAEFYELLMAKHDQPQ